MSYYNVCFIIGKYNKFISFNQEKYFGLESLTYNYKVYAESNKLKIQIQYLKEKTHESYR